MKASEESIFEFDLNESSEDDIVYFYLYSLHLLKESINEDFNKVQEELNKNGNSFESNILSLNPTDQNEILINLLDKFQFSTFELADKNKINELESLIQGRLTGIAYLMKQEFPKFKSKIVELELKRKNGKINLKNTSKMAYDLYVDAYYKYQVLKKTKRLRLTCKVATYIYSVGMNLYKNERKKLNIKERHMIYDQDMSKYDVFDKDIILSNYLPINTKDLYDFIQLFFTECHQLAVMRLKNEFSWGYIAQTLNQNVDTLQNKFSDCKKRIVKTIISINKI